jgi:hypothetical protein
MNIKTVTQSKPNIALNDFPKYTPDHIRFKLVAPAQTNAKHGFLSPPNLYQALGQLGDLLMV